MSLQSPVSKFQVEMYTKNKDIYDVPTRYEFLRGHNGIRPNCLHGLIGTSGSGKSTLFKCIITETAQHKKVLIWLSEESIVEYQELIMFLDPIALDCIQFVEEKSIPEEYKISQDDFLAYFEQMVEESGCDVVFIDNVTTSCFYNQRYGFIGQNRAATYLADFVKRKCSVFYVGHTAANVTDNYSKVVGVEDIRGSKELPIQTEYFYCMQKFTSNDKQFNVLRVAKFRHHPKAAGWYALTFENYSYIGDASVPFNLINKIFKSRDHLGRKDAKTTKK